MSALDALMSLPRDWRRREQRQLEQVRRDRDAARTRVDAGRRIAGTGRHYSARQLQRMAAGELPIPANETARQRREREEYGA